VALWRHFPVDDLKAETQAAAHLHFQASYDWDFLKITPSSGYFVYGWGVEDEWRGHPHGTRDYTKRVIHSPKDWGKLQLLNPEENQLGEQIRAVKLVRRELGDTTPIIFTIFNPVSQAKKLVGDVELFTHLAQHPEEITLGLEIITETTRNFINAVLDAGADGIFYAVQHAQPNMLTRKDYLRWGRPFDLQALEAAGKGWLNLLHLHGDQVYFDQFTDYPIQIINWHDLETPPNLADGKDQFPGTVCGGIRQEGTLNLGTREDVLQEAKAAISATNGQRFILGTGCVAPTTTPHGNLMAVRKSVENL
jgi:uroporphyrinogen decarboxylase